jgi:membrane AbrB-like protein
LRHAPRDLKSGLLLLAVGAAGGWFAVWVGIPAGVIVGALLTSAIYRLLSGASGPWRERYGRLGRVLLGTVIGAAFGSDVIAPLKTALLPMLVVIAAIIGVGLALGWALGRFTPLDTATGLIGSVPGGLPAMAAIADDSNADATVVTAIHFARLITILLLIPALVPLLATGADPGVTVGGVTDAVGFGRTAATLGLGLAGAFLALRLHVPTGDLIGPIVVIGTVNVFWAGPGPLAEGFRTAAMLFIGMAVGTQVSRESLRLLRHAALPAAAVIATLVSAGLALGWGLSQVTSLDLVSALLTAVPGGASTMPAVAHDLGGDMRLVAALHLTRQLIIFILVPSVLSFLLRRRSEKRYDAELPSAQGTILSHGSEQGSQR